MRPIFESPFLFCEAHSIDGAGFIISTIHPFYAARVLRFKDTDQYLSSMANSVWPVCPVAGYMILIQFSGSLVDGRKLVNPDGDGLKEMVQEMAAFYYQEKIAPHASFNKKYLIR